MQVGGNQRERETDRAHPEHNTTHTLEHTVPHAHTNISPGHPRLAKTHKNLIAIKFISFAAYFIYKHIRAHLAQPAGWGFARYWRPPNTHPATSCNIFGEPQTRKASTSERVALPFRARHNQYVAKSHTSTERPEFMTQVEATDA